MASRGTKKKELSAQKRLKLVQQVYQTFINVTESFTEDHIGVDLAYLFGAIAKNSCCHWDVDRPIILVLREQFTELHPVWQYIRTDEGQFL